MWAVSRECGILDGASNKGLKVEACLISLMSRLRRILKQKKEQDALAAAGSAKEMQEMLEAEDDDSDEEDEFLSHLRKTAPIHLAQGARKIAWEYPPTKELSRRRLVAFLKSEVARAKRESEVLAADKKKLEAKVKAIQSAFAM